MKRRCKRRHCKKRKLVKSYKKQIIQEVTRLSRNYVLSDCRNIMPIRPHHKLFIDGDSCDAMISRGLWLNQHLYQEGYIGVAIRLLDFIRLSDSNAVKDSYIFVALFCFRHYLELTMKDTLIHYYQDKAVLKIMECRHNLVSLFREVMNLPNMHQDAETNAIENIINTIQGYDPTGTVFRYPYSINEQTGEIKPSIRPRIGLKDVRILKTRMMQLYNFFDGVNSMVLDYRNK